MKVGEDFAGGGGADFAGEGGFGGEFDGFEAADGLQELFDGAFADAGDVEKL